MNLLKEIRFAYFIAALVFSCFLVVSGKAQCNVDAGSNAIRCLGSNLQLDGTGSTGATTYSWSPATGLSCTNCPSPICTATTNTTYTLTVTDGSGCTDTDQVTVTVAPSPTASFTFSQTDACANIPVSFSNTSTGTGLSYDWNFSNPASGSNNSSNTHMR